MKLRFDLDWYFKKEGHDHYRKVFLPHDWSIEGEYERDNPTGRRCGFLPAGVGLYLKEFEVSDLWIDKIINLLFDGIYMNSEVRVNGELLGFRPYGYVPVHYDISRFLKKGKNVITVKVDNSKNPSGRWYTGSGIYRHVWLIIKEKVSFQDNVFIYASDITRNKATLTIEYSIQNKTNQEVGNHLLRTEIKGPQDNLVFCRNMPVRMDADSCRKSTLSCAIETPRLWSPEAPNLYQVRMSLVCDNNIVDEYMDIFGIRTIKFDADHGMFLNGENIKLKGVCLHHDAGPLGTAVPDNILANRIRLLKAMGCNAIRTGHTPFAPEFYRICDKLGLMVIDEIFDGWHKKADYDYGARYFKQWWQRDVTDFVLRDRNHPCVILWSIGNETGPKDIHGITKLFHQLDPKRQVTGGEIHYGVDIPGFNGSMEIPGNLEKFKLENPGKCVLLTETPHSYQTRGFYRTKKWFRDYKRARHDVKNVYYEEVFNDYVPEYTHMVTYNSSYDNHTGKISNRDCWARTMNTDYIIGQFMWTGFDYLGESFGWPYRAGNHAPIDLCGFPKDIYYFYQSMWTTTPMIHILPHWTHSVPPGTIIPVWVYTNCDSVELFLNGKTLGRKRRSGVMHLEWYVPYHPGELRAIGQKNGIVINENLPTAGEPYSFTIMRPEDSPSYSLITNLTNGSTSAVSPGQDKDINIIDITVSIVDQNDNFVPYADNRLFIYPQGNARVKALGNGDPADLGAHGTNSRKVFKGLCKAFIQTNKTVKKTDRPSLLICGILGKTYFKNQTKVNIEIKQHYLDGNNVAQKATIFFTIDGSAPTPNSERFTTPITINKDTRIKALIKSNGHEYEITQDFKKGLRKAPERKDVLPTSPRITGKWINDEDKIYAFLADGTLHIYQEGEKIDECSWWYEEPVDEFENEESDIDNGEINFMWWVAKIRLQIDNRLRVKDRFGTFFLKKSE